VKELIKSIVPLLLGVTGLQLGAGLFGTFLAVRMADEGYSELVIGGVGSAYFGGFIAGALLSGLPVRRVGHIRAFAALAAVMSASTLLFALIPSAVAWGLLRFVNGLALCGLFVIVESWLNERADNRTRGRVFSIYMAVNFGAVGVGQFMLAAYPVATNEHFILVAIFYALALLPVALSVAPAPEPYALERLSLSELYRISPLGVAGCVAAGLVYAVFYSLAPVYVLAVGYGAGAVSTFMGLTILAGLALQWPLGGLSDRFDRRKVLVMIAAASAALAAAIVAFGGEGLAYLLLLGMAYGGASFTIYGLAVAHANDHLAPSQMVPASAGLLIAYGAGAVSGPAIGAAAMTLTGAPGLFGWIALVLAALALFGLRRMYVSPPVPAEEQIPYMAVPRTSPVIGRLDPRAEPEEGPAGAP